MFRNNYAHIRTVGEASVKEHVVHHRCSYSGWKAACEEAKKRSERLKQRLDERCF